MNLFENSTRFEKVTDASGKAAFYRIKPELSVHQTLLPGSGNCFSSDCRYLWFSTVFAPNGFLPGGRRAAAVWDVENDAIILHRDVQPDPASLVAPDGSVFWNTTNQILRKSPALDSAVERILEVPADMRIFPGFAASRITYSADHRSLIIDISEADSVSMCSLEHGNGCLTRWNKLTGGWCMPDADPRHEDRILFIRKEWKEYATGKKHSIERDENGNLKNVWVLNQGGDCKCVKTGKLPVHMAVWNSEGKNVLYCTDEGIFSVNPESDETVCIVRDAVHSFSFSICGKYLCYDKVCKADSVASGWVFVNLTNGKNISFDTAESSIPSCARAYGVDPAPRFAADGKVIAFNMIDGKTISPAFCCVQELAALTE